MKKALLLACAAFLLSCSSSNPGKKGVPVIGFLDFVQDETLAQAKKGFFDALSKAGYSEEKKNIQVIYRNAQGDQPNLIQACDYMISEKADLIASNTTLSTITAVQKTKEIPVCMMVAPRPDLARLTDAKGMPPANLFGVYETLEYIDTSMMLIRAVLPSAKKIGTIYNQAEPQSVDAFNRIHAMAYKLGFELVSLPVNSSADAQLVTESLLNQGIDAFFALPDNVIFSSFETVAKSCNEKKVPIFTSEAGLVKRGALAAFGADMYQWGYQAGEQAAKFLAGKGMKDLKPEPVKVRRRVFNPKAAQALNITFDTTFTPLN